MMIDWLWLALKWLAIAAAVSPIVIGVGWAVVEGSILPRLVPGAEIEAMADAVMRDHAEDPEEWAFVEEHAAWCQSHTFEQGKWRRVRRAIRRRLLVGELPPAALRACEAESVPHADREARRAAEDDAGGTF